MLNPEVVVPTPLPAFGLLKTADAPLDDKVTLSRPTTPNRCALPVESVAAVVVS